MTIVRVTVDRENVNDEFVIVRKIYGRTGALVAADDPVMEVETSKTIREILSPASGTINVSVLEGDEVAVGGRLHCSKLLQEPYRVPTRRKQVTGQSLLKSRRRKSAARGTPEEKREFSRAAERLAQDLAIPAESLPTGWVVAADVLRAAGKGRHRRARQRRLASSREQPLSRAAGRADDTVPRRAQDAAQAHRVA